MFMHVGNHAHTCMWDIMHIKKKQTCMLLIIIWYDGRNLEICTKLVLKPLVVKISLSISVLCIGPFL